MLQQRPDPARSTAYARWTTLLEGTRKGMMYKADNWTLSGTTAGATKIRNGIDRPADNWKETTPKLVFCKWRDDFNAPCSAYTHEWARKLCPVYIPPSGEEQPWKPRTIAERWAAEGSESWSGEISKLVEPVREAA